MRHLQLQPILLCSWTGWCMHRSCVQMLHKSLHCDSMFLLQTPLWDPRGFQNTFHPVPIRSFRWCQGRNTHDDWWFATTARSFRPIWMLRCVERSGVQPVVLLSACLRARYPYGHVCLHFPPPFEERSARILVFCGRALMRAHPENNLSIFGIASSGKQRGFNGRVWKAAIYFEMVKCKM